MQIVVVDLGDIGIGDDDEREIAQSLDSMRQAGGETREGEVGG